MKTTTYSSNRQEPPPAPVPFRSTNSALKAFFAKRGITNPHPWRKAKQK